MALLNHIFLGILILQIYVHAAPSDVSKLEDIAKVKLDDDNVETAPKEAEENSSSAETARQKRFYNPYGYGFPPMSPLIYPNFNNRNDYPNTGPYGIEDPLVQIHRRVQEIANVVRQPLPPQIPHIPIFYPVLFVPPFDCRCNPDNTQPIGPTNENNQTSPNVTTRFPEMEDERQNWGIVVNQTPTDNNNNDDQGGQDFTRPISFDPIRLNRPTSRPPPPVEHGTVQGDEAGGSMPPPSEDSPPPDARPPSFESQAPSNPPPPPRRPPNASPGELPSACDGAILTCCHQPQIIYDCFLLQGCPNLNTYGNPCEPSSILRVIERFQQFYGNRSG